MSARALRTLLIFAREPNPLSAKTRLAPMFDGAQRVALYTAFLRDVADASRDADCDRRVVLWSPEEEPALLNDIFEGHELASQRGPDLGSRISHAFGDAFVAPGASSVVLIGSDAPLLGGEAVREAWDMLDERDIVLTPSHDGGYCLIGARAEVSDVLPALFLDMRWSESDVFAQTIHRIETLIGCRPTTTCGILPMCYDIDTPQDVLRFEAHLHALDLAGQPLPQHTLAALRSLR
ncbi:glycosyltransferase [Candidatus Poribacteria bacterium]|jgi:uncharacterized protein|nr:glycosyltransferase [Candidatus Poribacteria bacterium]MBT5535970.1 glycosyltransferase [Candidatus Poribacteria bacterium]MBT5713916.1 glycosyltransferase [Candidatus Poribacteria bacterium]MBT7095752.1 glycosyltransferase [Candidatus Poribacteria bacterium]MBT7808732.1 glycosyltransferase [Candidatus Poribacteria bacterium]